MKWWKKGYLKLEGRREVVTPSMDQCDSKQGRWGSRWKSGDVRVLFIATQLHSTLLRTHLVLLRDEITHEHTQTSGYATTVP